MHFPMRAPDPQDPVTVANTSTAVVAANAKRTHLILKADKDNSEEIWISYVSDAVVDKGIPLDAGESRQFGPLNGCTCAINAISDSGSQTLYVEEA